MFKRGLAEFQAKRLTQARQAKGWNKATLAVRAGLTRPAISSFEKETNGTKPTAETLRTLARELDVSPAFLTAPLRGRELESSLENAVTFRSLAASTKADRAQAKVQLTWIGGISNFIEEVMSLQAERFPKIEFGDAALLKDSDIEEIAAETRKAFGIGDGPISDLTLLLENHGAFIGYVDLASGVDGISAWIDGRPVIAINSNAFAARARYDLAHELGHLILHRNVSSEEFEDKNAHRLYEHQANFFGGCFHMPENTFSRFAYGIDLKSLIELKKQWGVSMQAAIMRMHSLGLISESQKTRAFQQISAAGFRRKEPLDGEVPREQTRLFKKVADFLRVNSVLTTDDFFLLSGYPEAFLEALTGLKRAPVIEASNVVQFRLKVSS